MSYTNQKLGIELNRELAKGYDISRISKWALCIFHNYIKELNQVQRNVIEELLRMEDDPQFEYTENELRFIAKTLILGEKDPIKEIKDKKPEEFSNITNDKEIKHTKKQIGNELLDLLNKGYNIERISNWADELSIRMQNNGSPELDDILQHILIMDAGPEFEYTERELRFIAKALILGEKDPIKELKDIKPTQFNNESDEKVYKETNRKPIS